LAWARTYLKKAGFLENSSRGVWALTDKAKQVPEIDSREIVNYVRSLDRKPVKTVQILQIMPIRNRPAHIQQRVVAQF